MKNSRFKTLLIGLTAGAAYACLSMLIMTNLISCGKTIRLERKDFRWVPYKGNEILVFHSNTGDADTIFLSKAYKQTSPTDPLDIFPTNLEHFTITSRHTDPNSERGKYRYLEGEFLELAASESKSPYLSLYLTCKDSWLYGGQFMYLNDLDTIQLRSLVTQLRTYNDVFILKPKSNEYLDRSNFILNVYWSKSEGLVRYDRKNGVYWELTNKYSP